MFKFYYHLKKNFLLQKSQNVEENFKSINFLANVLIVSLIIVKYQ